MEVLEPRLGLVENWMLEEMVDVVGKALTVTDVMMPKVPVLGQP